MGKVFLPLLTLALFAGASRAEATSAVVKIGSSPLGKIAIKGGGHQVTINGRPIYTFAFDTAPGDPKGQGAQGVWYVILPTGKEIKVLKLATKSAPQPTKASVYGRSNY